MNGVVDATMIIAVFLLLMLLGVKLGGRYTIQLVRKKPSTSNVGQWFHGTSDVVYRLVCT